MYEGQRQRVIRARSCDPITNTIGPSLLNELENTYGKYWYVPFDIPIIKTNDTEHFVSWWFSRSRTAVKQKPNIANPGGIYNSHFKSINSDDIDNEVWTKNFVKETFDLFPELREQVEEYFPINYLGTWRMWSSTAEILNHRDDDSLVDFPCAMRIKLYDENPVETLWIREDDVPYEKYYLPALTDTNSFAWNNLRTYHGSSYNPLFKKILWLITIDNNLNVNKYIDLMDRSISKYNQLIMTDHRPREYYYDL
jgi:hypothetical protein